MEIQTEKRPEDSRLIPRQFSLAEANQLEKYWQRALQDSNSLFSISGDEKKRNEDMEVIRNWALQHSPRITVRKYSHPELDSSKSYFTLHEYRRRGTW